jgi:hypothetical protein
VSLTKGSSKKAAGFRLMEFFAGSVKDSSISNTIKCISTGARLRSAVDLHLKEVLRRQKKIEVTRIEIKKLQQVLETSSPRSLEHQLALFKINKILDICQP